MMSSAANVAKKSSKRKDARRPSSLHGYDDVVDCGDLQFSAEQKELLDLIEKQDVNEVREFFTQGPAFDMSGGEIGPVALRLAIENGRADIVEVVLENGARVGNALHAAVIAGSRECVELVLDPRFFKGSRGDIGPTDLTKRFFISPLMIAVRLEDHDMIQVMMSKGYGFSYHFEEYQEIQPSIDLQEDMKFLWLLNHYRTISNPLHMGYYYLYNPESEHPLVTAFYLQGILDHKAIVDHEFKKDYKKLSEGCEEFAVSLLEQCRTTEEIRILTDLRPDPASDGLCIGEFELHACTEEAEELIFLNMALRKNNDKVCMMHKY